MTTFTKIAICGLLTLGGMGALDAITADAQARGGGSNFMNSAGYQRRLQESRGYVTNRSGSVVTRPTIVTPLVGPRHRRRH